VSQVDFVDPIASQRVGILPLSLVVGAA
jgi:hypothetical protein